MNNDRKKELIKSLREESLKDDFNFKDLMSYKDKKKIKKQIKFEEHLAKDIEISKKIKQKKELEQTKKIEKAVIKEAVKKDYSNKPDLESVNFVATNNHDKGSKKINKFTRFCLTITVILIACFWLYSIFDSVNRVNQVYILVCSSLISLGCILLALAGLMTKYKPRNTSNTIGSACLLTFAIINGLVLTNILTFPKQAVLQDFTSKNVNVAMKWASENKININPTYEYSDSVKENYVITQNKKGDILARNLKELKLVVSSGPNYDLEANIPDMTNWNVDAVVKKVKELKLDLEKVNIDFAFNDAKRDTLYEQSKEGKIKRNEAIDFKFSLGKVEYLKPIKLNNLRNYLKFDAMVWLKRNGIKFEFVYKFDDTVQKGNVISTDPAAGSVIKQSDTTVKVYISKGNRIIAPDFTKMSLDEIIEWASKNKVNLNYTSEYNASIKAGGVIRVSANPGSIIEEDTTITVVTSKGVLKMISYGDDVSKIRAFAEKNGIALVENSEFNKDITLGKIIRVSHKPGQVINTGESIEVVISKGGPIKIPNFIGMSERNAKNTCSEIGLDCTISYVYSSKDEGSVINQNKDAFSEVPKDTNVVLSISKGSAPSYDGGGSSSGGSSSGGGSDTGGGTITPSCDRSQGDRLNIQAGKSGYESYLIIMKMNPKHKIVANYVGACPNGDTAPGTVCSILEGVWVSYCDDVVISLVK